MGGNGTPPALPPSEVALGSNPFVDALTGEVDPLDTWLAALDRLSATGEAIVPVRPHLANSSAAAAAPEAQPSPIVEPRAPDVESPLPQSALARLVGEEANQKLASLLGRIDGWDRFGLSRSALAQAFPFFYALYKLYFRVQSTDHEKIPNTGPIVLAADLGRRGLDSAKRQGPEAPELQEDATTRMPTLVAASASEALGRLQPTGEPLTFRSSGIGRPDDVELRPFYGLYDRRHSVYLRVETEASRASREAREQAAEAARRAVNARTVDSVVVGALTDEEAHGLEQERASAWSREGRSCRSTRYGGSWSYTLRLPESGPAAVRVSYWGGETRRHRFDVVAEGETLATQALFDDRPGELYEVEYPLPERLTRSRERVRVGFRTGPAQSTGSVFGVRVVRPASPANASRACRTPAATWRSRWRMCCCRRPCPPRSG